MESALKWVLLRWSPQGLVPDQPNAGGTVGEGDGDGVEEPEEGGEGGVEEA